MLCIIIIHYFRGSYNENEVEKESITCLEVKKREKKVMKVTTKQK